MKRNSINDSKEAILINALFIKPERRKDAELFKTTEEIHSYLEENTEAILSSKEIGLALHDKGFKKFQRTIDTQTQWVWSIKMVKIAPSFIISKENDQTIKILKRQNNADSEH